MRPKWRMLDFNTNAMLRPGHVLRCPLGMDVVILSFTPPVPGIRAKVQVRPLSGVKPQEYPPQSLSIKLKFSLTPPVPREKLLPRPKPIKTKREILRKRS